MTPSIEKHDYVSLHAAARRSRSRYIGCLLSNALARLFAKGAKPSPCGRLAAQA